MESAARSGTAVKRRSPQWEDLASERAFLISRVNLCAQALGWFAVGVGLVVLVVGWWLDIPAFTSLISGQQAVRPNTAVGIGLAGLTLVGVTRGWNTWVPGGAAWALFAIGAVTVGEYLLDSPWSYFDDTFAHMRGEAAQAAAFGRMGANVALDFVLLGTAGILLAADRAPNIRQGLAAVANAVAGVALLGYLLGVPASPEGTLLSGIGMALATALAQLALGAGFLGAMPQRGWASIFASPLAGGRIVRFWIPGLMAAMATALWIAERDVFGPGVAVHIGLSVSVLVVVTATFFLAVRTDRLDRDRMGRAAAAVDRSERLYRLGFEGSPVGIGLVDRHGKVVEANQALAAILGKPVDAIAGRESIATLIDPDRLSANRDILNGLASGTQQEASFESALSGADGRSVPVAVDVVRLDFADETLMFAFVSDLTERELKNQQLEKLAELDPLTGVLNRRSFLEHVQSAIGKAVEERTPCAVFFIDIDGFKLVNDVYGHRVGDRLLSAIADRLVQNTRDDRSWVGRLGGDEFAVVLAGCPPQAGPSVALRLQTCVSEPIIVAGVALTPACSIGYAFSDGAELDCEELMARADLDMYATRRARREGLAGRVEELRQALDARQLITYLQPVWAIGQEGLTLHGYEALVRWQHPDKGLVPPQEFIQTAEDGGLIHQLDVWAATAALRQMATQPNLALAINCSALTLVVPGIAHELIGAIRAVNRDPKSVIVELTESVDIPENSQIMKSLNDLRHEGIQIALDDFGSGYAGLNNLRTLPIDIVKIDRSLIATLAEDSSQSANTEHFLGGIRQLTQAMGKQLLAEGIENFRQLELIQNLGFDYVQGFLLGPPRAGDLHGDQPSVEHHEHAPRPE